MFIAADAQPVDAARGVSDLPASMKEVVPGPVVGRVGDAGVVKQIAPVEYDAPERAAEGDGPDMGRAIRSGAADDRPDFRVDAKLSFRGGHAGEVAVFRPVQRVQESLLDIGVGLPEVDVDHIRRHTAGDGQQRTFHPLDLDAGEAVEFDADVVPVVPAVSCGVGLIARAVAFGKYGGEASDELADSLDVSARGSVRPARVRQIEEPDMDDRFARAILHPTGKRC